MGLDLTTFVLEIVNFLVLLWLLTRFLYRPVQAEISRRQQQAAEATRALQAGQAELQAGQAELKRAREAFDVEREQARQRLGAEIAAERTRRVDALKSELEDERAKANARDAAQREQDARRRDEAASRRALAFVRSYLEPLAGPALEEAITALFLSDLVALDEASRNRLREARSTVAVEVATAFEPSSSTKRQVEAALEALLGQLPRPSWRIDSHLMAGISVRLDGHLLEASLARGLDAFADAAETAP